MAGIKEIRTHIKSVEQTLKITNAMYLISSSNLRKARKQLEQVRPFFDKTVSTIADILRHSEKEEHRFFDHRDRIPPEERKVGYLVITGDKGLAGAYNHNILKLAEERIRQTPHFSLYIIGQVGRSYFNERGIPIEEEFHYAAQNPTIYRARNIAELISQLFLNGDVDEVYVMYTNLVNSFRMDPTVYKLLPLDPSAFEAKTERAEDHRKVTYLPNMKTVVDRLVPHYLGGVIFGAMVDSFCSEQNARMTAMKTSTDNAREMLKDLNLAFNRARQGAITQEITEIVGGAAASR